MKPTVYIETTIPSYYWDERTEIAKEVARTKEWWDQERNQYECFVSEIVIEELKSGNYPYKSQCLAMMEGLPLVAVTPDVAELAVVYQKRGVMPQNPAADSVHLALATYYRLDCLLTWNCRHLANTNKIRHLESLNQSMGWGVPTLTTPFLLQVWEK